MMVVEEVAKCRQRERLRVVVTCYAGDLLLVLSMYHYYDSTTSSTIPTCLYIDWLKAFSRRAV